MRALLLIFILCFTACQSSNEQEKRDPSKPQTTLRLNLYTEPPTLDPRRSTDATSTTVLQMLFEGLTRIGKDGKPTLAAAESVKISEDGKTYIFHLRSSNWSNGTKVTAYDFAYSWRWVLSPNNPAEMAYYLYIIKNAQEIKEGNLNQEALGIEVLDDQTLKVELSSPAPYLLELLTKPTFFPLPKKHVEAHPNWANENGPNYVGNGPFVLKEWRHHDLIEVEKSPSYWDKTSVLLNKIQLYMVEDSNTELNMFFDDKIDYVGKPISVGPPTDAIPTLRKEGSLSIQPFAATYFLFINTDHPILSNRKMRQALAYAIDREGITEHITQAGEIPATRFVPYNISKDSSPLLQNNHPAKAKALLNEALLELNLAKEELPQIVLSYNTNEAHHKVAQAIQQQWRHSLGLDVKLENQEWKVYLSKLQTREFEIARLSWLANYADPLSFLELFEEGDSAINSSGWENEKFQKLLDQTRNTMDSEKRLKLLHQAEALLLDEMPAIPLFFLTNSYLKKENLKGISLSSTGFVDFKKAFFE